MMHAKNAYNRHLKVHMECDDEIQTCDRCPITYYFVSNPGIHFIYPINIMCRLQLSVNSGVIVMIHVVVESYELRIVCFSFEQRN